MKVAPKVPRKDADKSLGPRDTVADVNPALPIILNIP